MVTNEDQMNDHVEASIDDLLDENTKSHQRFVRKTREELLAPYFTPRNEIEYFRIFPNKEGKYLSVAHFHNVKVGKKYTKLYCPKHNDGTDCPLCNVVEKLDKAENKDVLKKVFELKKKIKETQPSISQEKMKATIQTKLTPEENEANEKNERIYKAKKDWVAIKFYIVRGIDKMKLQDGIKFWRFKFNSMSQGVLDILTPVLKVYNQRKGKSPLSFTEGADLIITTTKKAFANNPNRTYLAVSNIQAEGPQPAVEDQAILNTLKADKKEWKDVFTKKQPPYLSYEEFLKLVAIGKAPYYDDSDPKAKRWVYPDNPELEIKANTRSSKGSNQTETDAEEFNIDPDSEDSEITSASYSNEQVRQHRPAEINSTFVDRMLSDEKPAKTGTGTPKATPPTGSLDTSDASIDGLPF